MMTRLCDWLGCLSISYPRWVLAFYAVLSLALLPLLLRLPLEADVRNALPSDMARALERHNTLFGSADLAFLLVQSPSGERESLVAFAAGLQERLRHSPLIRSVDYGYDPALLEAMERVSLDYAPFFVTPAQLDDFDQLLTPQGMHTQMQKTLLQLQTMGTGLRDQILLQDPLQLRLFAFARLLALRGTFRFDTTSAYFLSADGTALLIKIAGRPSVHDLAGAKATVAFIQQSIAALQAQTAFQQLTVQATGGYFFAAESEQVIRGDIVMSVHLSIVSLCALLVWVLRRWGVIIYAFLPTLLSLLLALGLFAALRPTLNALTLGCIASLIGFGMDFSVHVLQRAFNEQGRGLSQLASLRLAVGETGASLLLAALTSMACFLAFHAASQSFLHDMGLLAALVMGLSCLLSVTFLPALLTCLPAPRRFHPPRTLGLPVLLSLVSRHPRSILALSLLLSVGAVGALLGWPPEVETDLRNIHAANSPTLQVQENIARHFGGSQEPLLLLVETSTETQAIQALHRLQPTLNALVQEGLLAAVLSPAMLYPEPAAQQEVLRRLRAKEPQQLIMALRRSLEAAGFASAAMQPYLERVQHLLSHRTPLDLSTFRALGFDGVLHPLLAHDAAGAVGVAMLFPVADLWTLPARDAITQRLLSSLAVHGIRGTLTGLYTVSSASAALLNTDFVRITLFALLGVACLVGLSMHNVRLTALILLPVLCGALWTAGFFALWNFKLNFMTICILPMLLATSSDYGIYIVQHFVAYRQADMLRAMRLTGVGVVLSALTTLEGFGTLALSANRGIASVGLVSVVGVSSCIVAALLTLPAVLQVWGTALHKEGHGACN